MYFMNRKQIKKDARKSLKRNYFRSILLVFIAGIIIRGGYNYTSYIFDINNKYIESNYTEVVNVFNNIIDDGSEQKNGVIAPIIKNVSESKSLTIGLANSIGTLIFKQELSTRMAVIIAFFISLLFYVFIQNVLKVGRNRYFLEQRRYRNTKIDKLLFPFQIRRTRHIAYILFNKTVYQFFWMFTIIGGIIKYYEYIMIPYVLAENPNINKTEAFRLSKEMTKGFKWELFKLDISMIGWYILQILTLGISTMFYFDAYKECVYAETYMYIRRIKKKDLTDKKLLNDKYLDIKEVENKAYPKHLYTIPIETRRKFLDIDYRKKYNITTYILFFFTFSFIGWIWEVLLLFLNTGEFVNRGTLYGPWIHIYGYGGLLILLLLKPLRKKPVLFFICTMLLAGILEYSAAWYLETFKGLSWWTYQGYFLNIHGRICLEGLFVFGLGGSAVTYFAAPILNNIYSKIPRVIKITLCVILLTVYGIDFAYSTVHPNNGNGVTTQVIN